MIYHNFIRGQFSFHLAATTMHYRQLMFTAIWLKLALAYNLMSDSWAVISRGTSEPRCVAIPANLTLCQGLEYTQMRLPNNLDHETLFEVTEQSAAWVNLLNLNCHTDAKLFLCSLFAPVCLPRFNDVIKPCQSLCLDVKKSCAPRMAHYGFSWPDMLNCDKFPSRTGLCIQPRRHYGIKEGCTACNEVDTFENILDNFCRSTHVFRAKIKGRASRTGEVQIRRGRAFKPRDMSRQSVRSVHVKYQNEGCQCSAIRKNPKTKYLIMATLDDKGVYHLNLMMHWNIKKKTFKKAVRLFNKIDCSKLGEAIIRRARRNRARLFQRNAGRRRQRSRRYDLRDAFL